MKLRISKPAPGTRWSIRETARLLNVSHTVIMYQIRKKTIHADGAGVDAVSAYEWAKGYEPHRDNAKRRVRARTIPQMQAAAQSNGNGHARISGAHTLVERPLVSRGARANTGSQGNSIDLSTREWVERFYLAKARAAGGQIAQATQESYDWAFGIRTQFGPRGELEIAALHPRRFFAMFENLPMERRALAEYLQSLNNIHVAKNGTRSANYGKPLSAGAKALAHRVLSTFYNWLHREHGLPEVDMSHFELPARARGGPAFSQEEIRAMLALARDHSEQTIIMTFAQVGCREGELCSLSWHDPGRLKPSNPECRCCGPRRLRGAEMLTSGERGGGWVHAYGKPTRANEPGKRVLYIPSEAYEALSKHLRTYGVMSLRGARLDDGAGEERLRSWIRWLAQQAGCYAPGKNTHAFRRAFEAEFLRNGGSELVMDELLGHRKVDMRSLYFNMPNSEALDQAIRYAPMRFLQQEMASALLPGMPEAAAR